MRCLAPGKWGSWETGAALPPCLQLPRTKLMWGSSLGIGQSSRATHVEAFNLSLRALSHLLTATEVDGSISQTFTHHPPRYRIIPLTCRYATLIQNRPIPILGDPDPKIHSLYHPDMASGPMHRTNGVTRHLRCSWRTEPLQLTVNTASYRRHSINSYVISRNLSQSSSLQANRASTPPSKTATPPRIPKPPPHKITPRAAPGERPGPRGRQSKPNADADNKQTLTEILQNPHYRVPLVGGGIIAMALACYLSLVITSSLKAKRTDRASASDPEETKPHTGPCHSHGQLPNPTGRPSGVDAASPEVRRRSAEEFDKGLAFPEWLMGITGLRKTLGLEATGDVLEVAMGTGRNLGYYGWSELVSGGQESAKGGDSGDAAVRGKKEGALEAVEHGKVRSFTGLDISADMVAIARDRLREAIPGLKKIMRRHRAEPLPEGGGLAVDVLGGKARLFIGDAEKELPPPPSGSGKYDTVIQTFGLCSVAEPAKLLANLATAVKPDTGRIILLEHGRGWYEWVNTRFLDEYAGRHFEKFGCWWNRDIESLVREAARTVPGLEVVELKRPLFLQFGTTLLVELRVNSKKAGGSVSGEKQT